MTLDDKTLVAQATAGDQESFRQLVEIHSRDIFRLAYRLTGRREDADDVVQEAFLRAYRSLDRFDSRSRFGTWLHRITVNCAMDHLRRVQREASRREPAENEPILAKQISFEPGPDRLASSGQIEMQVERALDNLSPIERAAFVLRHFEQLPITDIGHRLGSRTSATKHAVFRAVRKLRQELGPWMETRDVTAT